MSAPRVVAASVVLVLVAVMAGCGGTTTKLGSSIERGKACAEAGGEWTWSEWSGYHCEFRREANDE